MQEWIKKLAKQEPKETWEAKKIINTLRNCTCDAEHEIRI